MQKSKTNTIAIPKKLAGKDVVVITRREYEELLNFKKIKEVAPTAGEKKALAELKKNMKKNNFLTIDELGRELGFKN